MQSGSGLGIQYHPLANGSFLVKPLLGAEGTHTFGKQMEGGKRFLPL